MFSVEYHSNFVDSILCFIFIQYHYFHFSTFHFTAEPFTTLALLPVINSFVCEFEMVRMRKQQMNWPSWDQWSCLNWSEWWRTITLPYLRLGLSLCLCKAKHAANKHISGHISLLQQASRMWYGNHCRQEPDGGQGSGVWWEPREA